MLRSSRASTVLIWTAIGSAFLLSGYRLLITFVGRIEFLSRTAAYVKTEDLITNILVFWSLTLLLFACHLWRSAVRDSEAIETIISSVSPDVLLIVEPNRTISLCNPAVRDMFGYEPADLLQKTTDILYGDRRTSGDKREIFNQIEKTGSHIGGATGRRKDGTMFPLEIVTSGLKDRQGVVILIRDITLRKRVEEDIIRAKDAAEAASQTKSRFLANMSHELRTPLNAVIGFSDVLIEKHFGELNAKQEEYARNISESGRHLLSLINDILDLSKVEAGKMELNLSAVNIAALVRQSVTMIRERAVKHGITLVLEGLDGLANEVVRADERKLKQVMYNLLSNAAKFTPDGGRITIRAARSDDCVTIAVEDTGIGIAEAELEHVFEEFYQVRGSTLDKTPGTGLGLPLSRRLVDMHGGAISAASDGPGMGSRFAFTLPIRRQTEGGTSGEERGGQDANG